MNRTSEDAMRVWPGAAAPLGATFDGVGTNIAVFSDVAEQIDVCVFDDDGNETSVSLPERSGSVWHAYLPDLDAGTRYGLRVHGPYDPANGHRCNPNKLLLDPYARAIAGEPAWGHQLFGYPFGEEDERDDADSAPYAPKSVVVNPFFDWGHDRQLLVPWADTVIYEGHVRGATIRHPDIDDEIRGTYAGIAHPAFVEHLKSLGITTLELLPVHQFVHDAHLAERGLRNYWGYNTIGFFAPHNEYSHRGQLGQQVTDFKLMVKTLHEAGIEVILDVVYNHTAEGNHLGPTLSFKGLDNASYYRLVETDKRYYMDYTGTGNTLNMRHPYVLQLVMDSLRYWVQEMHVDGFRFDLASTLARSLHEVDRLSAFFDLVQQDPVVSQVKLIAEPWDVGDGGYQVGNFPAQWAEWNGRYRDCIRDMWAGAPHTLGEFAYRVTGSSDLYERAGRRPHASVNFITAHDGFTLRDLVSYNEKHNEANGEDNNDGESHNRGWNCGAEGPTDDAEINALRARQSRNLIGTLLLSQGVPMMLGGDEIGRTQHGNNNGYCQDNELSWFDWSAVDEDVLTWVRSLVRFRGAHPTFRRRNFFQGRPLHGTDIGDIAWFTPEGLPMTDDDWGHAGVKAVSIFLSGTAIEIDARGDVVNDDDVLWFVNGGSDDLGFVVPATVDREWILAIDSATGSVEPAEPVALSPGEEMKLVGRSFAVLRSPLGSLAPE
ncbi:MAG: glycogen debranching protein GlgX [Acidimicrobiia bacterium]